jgi:eukaryotic-like serine/threonine-protein kinase
VKHFFGILFRLLVLVMVALIAALTAMRFAIHGREVAMPKFIGMTPAEADRLAIANGLTLQIENRFYSAEIPAGHVLNQVPPAGEKVRRGWRVRVAESMGPQRVTVPNVVGQSERAAEINLVRRGLEVGTVTSIHLPDAVADTVLAQSPTADAEGVSSPKVNLVVAAYDPEAQAIVMPDVVGRALEDATRVVVSAGLRVGKVTTATGAGTTAQPGGAQIWPPPSLGAAATYAPATPPNAPIAAQTIASTVPIVVRQAPAAGQKVLPNANVNLDVIR